ncbi:GSCOCG00012577001-RA-CDS, partial [Cotesia congregata]
PTRIRPYRRSPVINEELNKQIDDLLERKYIRPSYSVWSCSPLMVAKANNKWRFCVDYRPLNRVTIPPAHPLPNMLRILSALHGAVYISTMDLKEAFHQIRMALGSIPLTAFSVEGRGQFEWLRMPYGLVGAPSTFQKAMDSLKDRFNKLLVERELPLKWSEQVFAYLDDWIVISEMFEEHLKILSLLLEVFREFGLQINPEKCKFCRQEVKFLGFIVDEEGLHPDPERIAPIVNFPRPTNRKQLRSFLGLINWYHRHLQDVAKAQGPLNKLTGVNTEWRWGEDEEKSFQELKQTLVNAKPLSIPRPGLPYYLYTDACDTGLGAFLVQRDLETKKEYLIICLSRPLRGAETRYTTTEKECLAVVWAVRKLRCYLEGAPFTVVTDHAALQWLHSLRDSNGRLARWSVEL